MKDSILKSPPAEPRWGLTAAFILQRASLPLEPTSPSNLKTTMNMKRIQIILAALVLSVSVSCTADFLDVSPTTEIPEKDYYDDYETLLKGLMAAYAPLQWPDFVFGEYGPLIFVSDVMSDAVRVG